MCGRVVIYQISDFVLYFILQRENSADLISERRFEARPRVSSGQKRRCIGSTVAAGVADNSSHAVYVTDL